MRVRALLTAIAAVTVATVVPTVSTVVPAAAGAATAPPTARHVTSIPAVGALFVPGVQGSAPGLGLPHYCSASVVRSASRDLVLTAAHCVYGTGAGIEFAPGYHDGVSPHGVWDVSRVYLDPAWIARHDPARDVAVLVVGPHGTQHVQDAVGGYPLGAAPAARSRVTVDGYPAGTGGTPITCTTSTYRTQGYPSIDCGGFADGVSGGPWLAGGRIVGVTGGLHQGGCSDATSYTAAFGAAERTLVARAGRGGSGDVAPLPTDDGC